MAADGWLGSAQGIAASWLTGVVPRFRDGADTWYQRLEAAGRRAAAGEAGPLLGAPTHAGGWIDPRVLVERVRGAAPGVDAAPGHAAAPGDDADPTHAGVDEVEFAVALLRLAPDGRAEALAAAADVPGRPGEVLRCALGGDPAEGRDWPAAAARAVGGAEPIAVDVEPDGLRPVVRQAPSWHRSGPLGDVFAALDPRRPYWERYPDAFAFPARRDLAAAASLLQIGALLGSDAAVVTNSPALMTVLLGAREPIAPLTLRLLVVALGSHAPAEHLLAVDVLVTAIEDGRVDALPVDDVALIKPNRLAPRLQSIAQAGPLPRAVVRDFLDAAAEHFPPRSGPLLVLFDELCAQTHTGPQRSRAFLQTLNHKAAKSLLKHEGAAAEAHLALAARVRRAERWMAA
jgi:hypothetical protein